MWIIENFTTVTTEIQHTCIARYFVFETFFSAKSAFSLASNSGFCWRGRWTDLGAFLYVVPLAWQSSSAFVAESISSGIITSWGRSSWNKAYGSPENNRPLLQEVLYCKPLQSNSQLTRILEEGHAKTCDRGVRSVSYPLCSLSHYQNLHLNQIQVLVVPALLHYPKHQPPSTMDLLHCLWSDLVEFSSPAPACWFSLPCACPSSQQLARDKHKPSPSCYGPGCL